MSEENVNTGFDALFHSLSQITQTNRENVHDIIFRLFNIIQLQNDLIRDDNNKKNALIKELLDKLAEKQQG